MREKLVKPFIGNLKSPNLIKIEKMDAPDQQNSDDSDNPEGSAPKKTKDGKSGTRIGGQNADTNGNEESKEDLLLKITQLELIILNTRRSEAYFKKKSEELIEKLHTIKILIEASQNEKIQKERELQESLVNCEVLKVRVQIFSKSHAEKHGAYHDRKNARIQNLNQCL